MITAVPVDLPDGTLAADVMDGLGKVEDQLRAAVRGDRLVNETARHLMDAGGKRFRATLVLLAAQFGDPASPDIVPAAVAIELTHLATLYHDDVMDEAAIRRGHPSANSRWGNTVAILTGDFLFAQASLILARLGPDAIRIQAETFSRLVNGQIAETVGPASGQDPLEHYLQVVADKTASLIATAGGFGARFAGAPETVIRRVTAACEALGMAWQLSDDVLDVASESGQSGKTPGTDLRRWADTARAEVLALPDVPARAAFETLCDYVVERTG